MAGSIQAIGFFCEDIRDEKSGQDTLIGILPDHLAVPAFPGMLPKLGIYVRIHLSLDANPKIIRVKLKQPDATFVELAVFDSLIGSSIKDASDNKLPLS